MSIITIGNSGADIAETNYWNSEHANIGLCYLSGNAGALRLLMPEAAEGMLTEMRTGRSVTIEPSIINPQCVDIVFEDGTDSPFCLSLDRKQIDRALDAAVGITFTVWTERGGRVLTLIATVRT